MDNHLLKHVKIFKKDILTKDVYYTETAPDNAPLLPEDKCPISAPDPKVY